MKREEEDRLVVGETVHHPDKSWKLNISATPQRAGSKVFLSWNSGRKRSFDSRFGAEIRDCILVIENFEGSCQPETLYLFRPSSVTPLSQTLAE
ncbi:hypothetical protein AVEN_14279-1 [Araneus ventricosus]|uniref:Uncharacterized protein n=1 Tax=Araneus ventricosus TaxID=182803 RepID=A0A4Y2MC05_ARAVE|nr:hypothetical protein AVEN_14279-1 [Araneus ventricosus]